MDNPTIKDVYERLGRIESLTITVADHEKRIRALEMVRNWAAGVCAAVAFLYGMTKTVVPKLAEIASNGS